MQHLSTGIGDQKLREIESLVRDLRRDFDTQLIDVKAQLNLVQNKTTEIITEHPLLSLCVAFIAGMAIGTTLSKPR